MLYKLTYYYYILNYWYYFWMSKSLNMHQSSMFSNCWLVKLFMWPHRACMLNYHVREPVMMDCSSKQYRLLLGYCVPAFWHARRTTCWCHGALCNCMWKVLVQQWGMITIPVLQYCIMTEMLVLGFWFCAYIIVTITHISVMKMKPTLYIMYCIVITYQMPNCRIG